MKKIEDITDKKCLHIFIGEDLKEKLSKLAKEKMLSLNAYIRMLLVDKVEKEENHER